LEMRVHGPRRVSQGPLAVAIGVSVGLHLLLLAVVFFMRIPANEPMVKRGEPLFVELPQAEQAAQRGAPPAAAPEPKAPPTPAVPPSPPVPKAPPQPKVAAVETQAAIEQPAVEATSRKTLEDSTSEAEKAKAPVIGTGKDRQKLTAVWSQKISAYLKLHKRFPDGKNKQKSGTVKVFIVLSRLGHVTTVSVAQSSGDAAFDEAAVAMVRRSDPMPRPPAALSDDEFKFTLPVDFTKPK